MSDTNVVVLVGRATRDVEVRYLQNGTAVADLGLAVNEYIKDQDVVSFIDVTVWAKQAEIAGEFIKKGTQVAITGKLQTQSWEKDGEKRYKTKVVAIPGGLQLLSSKNKGEAKAKPEATAEAKPTKEGEEIPF